MKKLLQLQILLSILAAPLKSIPSEQTFRF